ncbi:MAG TPA: hypothetical protein VMW08_16195, partial [Acidimicrobiales bacterium]|nr:hypothetical protein [Acidimicrobiales bacterium]
LRRTLPADDEWGEQGFTLGDREQATNAHITLSDALAWRELGCDIPEATRLLAFDVVNLRPDEFGIDILRPWVEAGHSAGHAIKYIHDGWTLDDFEPYIKAGFPLRRVHRLLDVGVGPEVYVAHLEAGHSESDARYFAISGLPPEQATLWKALGIPSHEIQKVLRNGGTLEEVRGLIAEGVDPYGISRRLRPGN